MRAATHALEALHGFLQLLLLFLFCRGQLFLLAQCGCHRNGRSPTRNLSHATPRPATRLTNGTARCRTPPFSTAAAATIPKFSQIFFKCYLLILCMPEIPPMISPKRTLDANTSRYAVCPIRAASILMALAASRDLHINQASWHARDDGISPDGSGTACHCW